MRRPILLLVLLQLALCACAQGPELLAMKLTSAAIAQGDQLVLQGGAGPSEALNNEPAYPVPALTDAEAALNRGMNALDGPDPATSLTSFQQAVALDPVLRQGHYLLGCAYQLNAQWDAAIAEFHQHIAMLRESPDADPTWGRAQKHIVECIHGKGFMAHAGNSFITSAGLVNTSADEFGPLPIVGGTLLFTRTSPAVDLNSERVHDAVFMSRWAAEGWTLADPITTGTGSVATACMNAEGKRPMLSREGAKGQQLKELVTTGDGRERAVVVPADLANDPTAGRPYLTSDGQWFYFSSARPGGLGGMDIYRCQWNVEKSDWSSAENLGAPINSEYDEDGPFLTGDGTTLYFASTGHSSMGGYDLFSSTCEKRDWSGPKNLGWPVNSPGDDRDLVLTPDEVSGYFSSDRAGGSGRSDIYRVDLSQGRNADVTAMLASAGPGVPISEDEQRLRLVGFIKELHMMEPVRARIELMDLADTSFTATCTSDPITGEFTVDVPSGRSYSMHVTADGFMPHSERIDGDPAAVDVRLDMGLQTKEAGNSEVLPNIQFGGNSCTLEPASANDLNQLLAFLRSDPTLRIEIAGHTDSDTGPMPNQELSEERANAVKDWLVDHGISPDRLLAKGYGASQPFMPNDSGAHMALNRRTEIKVL